MATLLALERDFSNIRQIAGILKDDKQLQKIADRTYDEIIGSRLYSDKILGLGLDALISKLIKRKKISNVWNCRIFKLS